MNYADSRQRKLYKKYLESDIFNTRAEPNTIKAYLEQVNDIFKTVSDETSGNIIKSLNEAKDILYHING